MSKNVRQLPGRWSASCSKIPRRSRLLLEIVHGLLESGAELAPTFGHGSV
jgi:hypothetical protein